MPKGVVFSFLFFPCLSFVCVTQNMKKNVAMLCAVSSYKEDVMLIDLERRFRPRLCPFFFPPIVLWIHVIVHLVDAPGSHGGVTPSSVLLPFMLPPPPPK